MSGLAAEERRVAGISPVAVVPGHVVGRDGRDQQDGRHQQGDHQRAHAQVMAQGLAVDAHVQQGRYHESHAEIFVQMHDGARIEVADYKKNPADFVLWKPSEADQPGWNSPWGYGRPGWHLECSAMSSKLLGNSFDIHGGGADLIFPHHENECAQSLCAYPGESFARYWVHGGMLMVDGVKMSKSLGNFYTIDEVLEKAPAEALRLLFLTTHYHQPFNFTFEGLEQAKQNLDKFYNALLRVKDVAPADWAADERVVQALEDDLNTPLALSILHDLTNRLNKAESASAQAEAKGVLLKSAELLGLLWQNPESWFKGGAGDETAEIEALISQRTEAKKNKDYELADKIRDDLKARGILLEDGPQGTSWKKV